MQQGLDICIKEVQNTGAENIKRVSSSSVFVDPVPVPNDGPALAAYHSHAAPPLNESGRNSQRFADSEASNLIDGSRHALPQILPTSSVGKPSALSPLAVAATLSGPTDAVFRRGHRPILTAIHLTLQLRDEVIVQCDFNLQRKFRDEAPS